MGSSFSSPLFGTKPPTTSTQPPHTAPICAPQEELGEPQLLSQDCYTYRSDSYTDRGPHYMRTRSPSVIFFPSESDPIPETYKSNANTGRGRRRKNIRSPSVVFASSEEPRPNDMDQDSDSEYRIPKPAGDAGRPGSGGYNLEKALKWERSRYRQLRKFMKKSTEKHLDTTKSFSAQSAAALLAVQDAAVDRFPALVWYDGFWPIYDCIRSELKYTITRARLRKLKQDAGQMITD